MSNEDSLIQANENLSEFFQSKDKPYLKVNSDKKTERLEKRAFQDTMTQLTAGSAKKTPWLQAMMKNVLIEAHEKRGSSTEADGKIVKMKLLDLNTTEASDTEKNRLATIKGGGYPGTVVLRKIDRDKETGLVTRIRRGIYIGDEQSTGGSIPFSFIYPFLVDAYQLTLQSQGYAVDALLQDPEFSQILDLLADLTGEIASDVFRHNKKKGGLVEFDGVPGKQFNVTTVSNDFDGNYQTPLKLVADYYKNMVAETTPKKLKQYQKDYKHFENAVESLISRQAPKAKIDMARDRLKEEKDIFEQRKLELKTDDDKAKARFLLDMKAGDEVEESVMRKVQAFNKWLNQIHKEGLLSATPGSLYESVVDQQIQRFSEIIEEINQLPGPHHLLQLSILYSRYKNAQTEQSGGLGTFMMKALLSQSREFVEFFREGNQVSIRVNIQKMLENWRMRMDQKVKESMEQLQNSHFEPLTLLLKDFPEKHHALIKLLVEKLVTTAEELLPRLQQASAGFPSWKVQEIKNLVKLVGQKGVTQRRTAELLDLFELQEYLEPLTSFEDPALVANVPEKIQEAATLHLPDPKTPPLLQPEPPSDKLALDHSSPLLEESEGATLFPEDDATQKLSFFTEALVLSPEPPSDSSKKTETQVPEEEEEPLLITPLSKTFDLPLQEPLASDAPLREISKSFLNSLEKNEKED
jgi:hypothetical protein